MRPLCIPWKCSQHLHEFRDLAQMAQGVTRGLVVAAQNVDEEDILPRMSSHRAGFDFAQADVAQREHA
jgi:hypothetical protein